MSNAVNIEFALVCDEIRREDNGKLILIGVYGRDIGVTELPANLVLSLAVSVIVDRPREIEVSILGFAGGEQKTEVKGRLTFEKAGRSLIRIPNLVFTELSSATDLVFKWKQYTERDEQVFCTIPFVGLRSDQASQANS